MQVMTIQYRIDWIGQNFLVKLTPMLKEDSVLGHCQHNLTALKNSYINSSILNDSMAFPINMLFWYSRGVANLEFLENFKELVNEYKPVICYNSGY